MSKCVHADNKLAHYARACTDILFKFPFGTQVIILHRYCTLITPLLHPYYTLIISLLRPYYTLVTLAEEYWLKGNYMYIMFIYPIQISFRHKGREYT
jgi:hypothetical protein